MNRQEAWENLMVLTDEILCGLTYEDMEETANQIKKYATLFKPPTHDPDTGLKGCLFCKAMDDYKALQIDPAFAYEYTAAIVSRLYKVSNPHSRGTSTNYGHGKFALNYCPMCGRKLEVEG